MSIGLDCFIEVRNSKTRKWEEHKFIHRPSLAYNYAIFSYDALTFLTGRKNDACMPWIGEDISERGWPTDSDWLNESNGMEGWFEETKLQSLYNDNDFNRSYVTLQELLDFNYDQKFLNRTNPDFHMGSGTGIPRDERRSLPEGQGFEDTVRKCIGKSFFDALDYLKELGNPKDVRVIYNLS